MSDITAWEAIKKMGGNCAVMAGVSFTVVIVVCAVCGVCPDDPAFIPVALAALGGGIAVGGIVTACGGDIQEI